MNREYLNKEDYEVICDRNQRNLASLKEFALKNKGALAYCSHIVGGHLITPLHKALWESYKIDAFVFSKSVFSVVNNMKTESVLYNTNVQLLLQNNEVGRLICRTTDINMEYAIIDGSFYCIVYHKTFPLGTALYSSKICGTNGIMDGPDSPIMCAGGMPMPPRAYLGYPQCVEMLKKDFPDGLEWINNHKALFGKNWEDCCDSGFLIEDLKRKKKGIEYALKMLVYLKTSKEITQEYIPDNTPTYKRKKGYRPQNYIQVDSTWNKNIEVNSPFPVSGHFRNQPKKDSNGEWYKELIYIEAFIKNGYHRKAKQHILS